MSKKAIVICTVIVIAIIVLMIVFTVGSNNDANNNGANVNDGKGTIQSEPMSENETDSQMIKTNRVLGITESANAVTGGEIGMQEDAELVDYAD